MHPRILVLTIVLFFASFTAQSYAQWEQCNGPWTGLGVSKFQTIGHRVYAFTEYGLYRTTNSGGDWTKVDCCNTLLAHPPLVAVPDANGDTLLYLVTYFPIQGAYYTLTVSSDFGDTWEADANPPFAPYNKLLGSGVTTNGDVSLYALDTETLLRSTDYGDTWASMWEGTQTALPLVTITSVLQVDTDLLVGSRFGVFRTTDFGQTWIEPDTVGDTPERVQDMKYVNGVLYVGAQYNFQQQRPGGLYASTDMGTTWGHLSPDSISTVLRGIHVSPDGHLIIAEGTFSTDAGQTWQSRGIYPPMAMYQGGSGIELFAQRPYEGIFFSQDEGATWTNANAHFATYAVNGFDVDDQETSAHTLYAGMESVGIFKSADAGDSWQEISNGIGGEDFRSLFTFPDESGNTMLFAGTTTGLHISDDDGSTWVAQPPNLYQGDIYAVDVVHDQTGTYYFAGAGKGAYRSTDKGVSWSEITNGVDTEATYREILHYTDPGGVTHVFLGSNGSGIFHSSDFGETWTARNTGLTFDDIHSLALVEMPGGGPVLLAGTNHLRIFRSTDLGMTWTMSVDGLQPGSGTTEFNISALHVYGYNIFAGISSNLPLRYGGGVFHSSNNGETWSAVDEGLERGNILNLHVGGNYLYASTASDAVWRRPLSEMVTVGVENPQRPSGIALHPNYPNPFTGSTSISWSVPTAQPVTLTVYNTLGQPVQTFQRDAQPGTNTVQLTDLNAGMYMVVLKTNSGTVTQRIIAVDQ